MTFSLNNSLIAVIPAVHQPLLRPEPATTPNTAAAPPAATAI